MIKKYDETVKHFIFKCAAIHPIEAKLAMSFIVDRRGIMNE